jgi:tRNA-dihydrouridine synthase B
MSPAVDKSTRIEALRQLIRGGGAACAPMAGITDRPFRKICRRMGSLFVTTELLSSEGIRREGEKSLALAAYDEEERPLGIQLFGADPVGMADGARRVEELGPDFIDINFGCPVKKVVKRNGGSACMKDLGLMEEIVRAVNEAVALPVSMKIRAGWDDNLRNAPDAARMAEKAGLAFVTVHGRTRTQMFSGRADLAIIRETREAVDMPVIGNGDVVDASSYQYMIDTTGVDTVLIGRGCIGNPWIFAEIEARRTGNAWTPPTLVERMNLLLRHMDAKVAEFGTHGGVVAFRKQMGYYIKGQTGASALRRALFATEDPERVREILNRYTADCAA